MFDAIVVGARCAGASLAMLLGRRGLSVLMIDAAEFPSDKVSSTHFIWQSGTACLERWGLLAKLEATGCPSHDSYVLDLGGIELRGGVKTVSDGVAVSYAPRRHAIDNLLVDEARAAGVEFLDACKVTELVVEGDRVVGLRYRDKKGQTAEARSRIVIGADGIGSTIAELAGAETYDFREKSQQIFFSYFEGAAFPEVEFYSRPGRMGFAWRTNGDEVVAGFCCRRADAETMTDDVVASFWRELETMSPALCQRLKSARQTAPVRTGGTPSFKRTAGGPGWALTGDAGLNMDPITASGISNAFMQAEMLSDAIVSGLADNTLDQKVEEFGRARDDRFAPFFEFTAEMAKLDPDVPEDVIRLFMALPGQTDDIEAYFGVFAQTVPVAEFFAPANLERIIAGGAAQTVEA